MKTARMNRYKKLRLLAVSAAVFAVLLPACAVSGTRDDIDSAVEVQTAEISAAADPTPEPAEITAEPGDAADSGETGNTKKEDGDFMYVQIGDTILKATLADNSSAEALKELLRDGPVTIEMKDYAGMEKVGSIGKRLPANNEQITTSAGDLILYQGSQFVIYYAPNSWNFTRLGRIGDITADELKELLGDGDVTVTLSLGD